MKKYSNIIQWFFAVDFALMSLVTGSIVSGIIVFIAAVLMAPIKPLREALAKIKIKSAVAIALSVVLLFAGVMISPNSETPDNQDDSTISGATIDSSTTTTTETTTEKTTEELTTLSETTIEESTTEEETITKKEESTTKKTETTTKKVTTTKKETTTKSSSSSGVMVWIPQSGSKYHSNSSCSRMKNPSKVTKQQAIDWGYDACSKCY